MPLVLEEPEPEWWREAHQVWPPLEQVRVQELALGRAEQLPGRKWERDRIAALGQVLGGRGEG